jgi:hypothetical protein
VRSNHHDACTERISPETVQQDQRSTLIHLPIGQAHPVTAGEEGHGGIRHVPERIRRVIKESIMAAGTIVLFREG